MYILFYVGTNFLHDEQFLIKIITSSNSILHKHSTNCHMLRSYKFIKKKGNMRVKGCKILHTAPEGVMWTTLLSAGLNFSIALIQKRGSKTAKIIRGGGGGRIYALSGRYLTIISYYDMTLCHSVTWVVQEQHRTSVERVHFKT
jgi:hypothetical protein